MDPITLAIVSGAAGSLTSEGVKSLYLRASALIRERYHSVDLTQIEKEPASKIRQALLGEELGKANARNDSDLVALARQLLETVKEQTPQVAKTIGVNSADLVHAEIMLSTVGLYVTGDAAAITVRDVVTGVRAEELSREVLSAYRKGLEERPQAGAPPEFSQIDRSETHFSKKRIRLVDVTSSSDYVIKDKVFEDCEIFGPAVVFGLGDLLLEHSDLGGTPDQLFIEVKPERALIGVIGCKNVAFRRCKFRGIGIAYVSGQIKGDPPGPLG